MTATRNAIVTIALLIAGAAQAQYQTRVILRDLQKPLGIHVAGFGQNKTLYFTQVPTPGLPGSMGGRNTVDAYSFRTGRTTNLTTGEPEPTNLSADPYGNLYWTCKSAGVILMRNRWTGRVSPLLTDLNKPSGISAQSFGAIYFTQVPTPGVPGGQGGKNTVDVFALNSVFNLTDGEPEPTDIAVGPDGTAYWTCKSAGVILARTRLGAVKVLLRDLEQPTGIAVDRNGTKLFFTEVPTPGVGGGNGGRNRVVELDLMTMVKTNVDEGDPQPTDITVANDGSLYWTCTSAGVIVEARRN